VANGVGKANVKGNGESLKGLKLVVATGWI